MNLKQNVSFFAGVLAVFALLAITGCSTPGPYRESRDGNYLYLNPFAHVPETSQEHLEYALSLKERGRLTSARKQFEILIKRWPDSAEAGRAKQAAADIYFEQGKNKKAFKAYEELIEQYYTDIKDYDLILDRQYTIATKEMNRRRMIWLFGGYRAPDRAIPYFESIIQNAPQWERAPEMQYMIGQAYQKNGDLDLAVVAYSIVEYRYPDSPFAEKAAIAKLDSYKKLVDSTPYSEEIREQAKLSTELFSGIYTNSPHLADVQNFRAELRDLSAKYNYEVGQFYERVPRPARNKSAEIYYEKTIEQYEGTAYAEKAAERSLELFPQGLSGGVMSTNAVTAPAPSVEDVFDQLNSGDIDPVPAEVDIERKGDGRGARIAPKPLPERITTDEEAVEIAADRMEYADGLLIGEGTVSVQQTGASLQADRVVVDSKTGEIDARGNIVMSRGTDYWEGQSLVYNYKTHEGIFGDSIMYFEPAYITAGSTERVSTNEFVMRDATITTCSGDNPTLYAKAKEVRVIDEQKASGVFIQAKQVTFYVGPVPVFYAPAWERHLGYRVFSFVIGAGSHLGAFVMGRAALHPTDWLTADTHFDLYSSRGLGVGQDFDWTTPNGHGGIETYYIKDSDPDYDSDDTAAERALADADRGRIKLTHREQLDDETYFATQLNWLSDPTILRDFFNDEYRLAANPENYAVVQHSSEEYAASLRTDRRLNNFYTTVDRTPELTFDWYRSKLGNSPFVFESENNVGFFQKQYGMTNLPSYDSVRLDTHNQLFLPLRFDEFFNVVPRAGYRGIWYGDTVTGDAEMRSFYEFGTLTSFKAYKTLTEKSGFYGTGLRHILEPFADYSYRDVNIHTNEILQFDDVDALDKQNEVRFGARNFLQSRRGTARQVNVLDSEIYTTYRLDPLDGERSFSNLVSDAEMSLTDNLFVKAGLEYDWYTRDVNPADGRIRWVTDDQSEYSFEYRYLAGTRSLLTPRVKLFPNDKWSYEFSASYDEMYDEWYERKILVRHTFDCIGMGAGVKLDEDDDITFSMQLWLTAFPQGSLGM